MALKEEVEHNVEILQTEIAQNKRNLNSATTLAYVIDSKNQQIGEDSLANLHRQAFSSEIWVDLNEAIIREIMNTGNLNIIHNQSIKGFISSWDTRIEKIRRFEDGGLKFRDACVNLVIEKGSHRRIIAAVGRLEIFNLTNERSDASNRWLLDSNEYENNLLLFIATEVNLRQIHYEPLLNDLEAMIDIIEKEIN